MIQHPAPGDRRLKVLYTVDTEAWPRSGTAPDRATYGADQARDMYGRSPAGEYGLKYQCEVLRRHGLTGVFLVESLFADAMGEEFLRPVVDTILEYGHEVQLHLHAEWLKWLPEPLLAPDRTGRHIADFSLEDQATLIARGLANLKACGAERVNAFRAGNYGANNDTLRALARHGVTFDTSHNTPYLGRACSIEAPAPFLQPAPLDGVLEFPITYFQDRPGHYRHAQLTACSARELEGVLLQAWRRGWYSFVIVSHSFELVHRETGRPDRIAVRRFERLCRFLSRNQEKFHTCGFHDIDPAEVPAATATAPLVSTLPRTLGRVVEQLARRCLA